MLATDLMLHQKCTNIWNICSIEFESRNRGLKWESTITCSLSQSSTELHDDSSKGIFGSKSCLTLTAEEDEVRTTRLRDGFFLHERRTFKVPSTAGTNISAYCQRNIEAKMQIHHDNQMSSFNSFIFFIPLAHLLDSFLWLTVFQPPFADKTE